MCPLEIFAALHAVPLISRMRLGNKIRNASGYFREPSFDFATDLGDRLSHFDDPFKIDGTFAGKPAEKIEFDGFVVVFKSDSAAFVKVIVFDLFANLFAHVVAGNFRCERQASGPAVADEVCERAQLFVHAETWNGDVDPHRIEGGFHLGDEFFEVRIVAAGERQDADFVEAGIAIAFEGSVDDRFYGTNAQRTFDHGALTEAALPRTAAHDFNGDAIVHAFDVRNHWRSGKRNAIEIANHTGLDGLRDIAARTIERDDSTVAVLWDIESRNVSVRQPHRQLCKGLFALATTCFT